MSDLLPEFSPGTAVLTLDEGAIGTATTELVLPGRVFRAGRETIMETAPHFMVLRSGDAVLVELGPPNREALARALVGLDDTLGRSAVRDFTLSVHLRNADLSSVLSRERTLLPGAKARFALSITAGRSNRPIVSRSVTTTLHAHSRPWTGRRPAWVTKPMCIAVFSCHSHWAFWAIPWRPLVPNTRCCGPCATGGCKCSDRADTHFLNPMYCYDIGWCECR